MKELSTYNKNSNVLITTRAKDTDEYVVDISSLENLVDFDTVKISTDLYCHNLDNNKQLAEISNKDIASIVYTLGYIKGYFEDFCIRNKDYPWVYSNKMTEEEKEQHPEYETTGGYLKKRNKSECNQLWWDNLSDCNKNVIKSLPNFNAKIFKEITGIDINKGV